MMILGVSGSPKKGGNTEYILDEALKVALERGFKTERFCARPSMLGTATIVVIAHEESHVR